VIYNQFRGGIGRWSLLSREVSRYITGICEVPGGGLYCNERYQDISLHPWQQFCGIPMVFRYNSCVCNNVSNR